MFTFARPTESQIIAHLCAQSSEDYSYDPVGCTRSGGAAGFQTDFHQVTLGHGKAVFAAACEAIRQWKMFPKQMAELYWPDRDIVADTVVTVLFRAGPLWSLNPCRILYVIDESDECAETYGFAYGTLPEHLERGEERFRITWNREDDSVTYDILAISKPHHFLAYLGYPIVRLEQARFRRLSGLAMQAAVRDTLQTSPNTPNLSALEFDASMEHVRV